MKYTASYDRTVKIITTLTILLLLFITVKFIYDLNKLPDLLAIQVAYLFSVVLMPGIIIGAYIYSPQYYILNSGELRIKRGVKDRVVALTEISEIRLLSKEELRGIIRVFGVGGLFGYFGKFRSRPLGTMNFYTTQSKNKLLLTLKDGEKLVITPDDIALMDAIKAASGEN